MKYLAYLIIFAIAFALGMACQNWRAQDSCLDQGGAYHQSVCFTK